MKSNIKKNKRRKVKTVGKTFKEAILVGDEIPPPRHIVAQTVGERYKSPI